MNCFDLWVKEILIIFNILNEVVIIILYSITVAQTQLVLDILHVMHLACLDEDSEGERYNWWINSIRRSTG